MLEVVILCNVLIPYLAPERNRNNWFGTIIAPVLRRSCRRGELGLRAARTAERKTRTERILRPVPRTWRFSGWRPVSKEHTGEQDVGWSWSGDRGLGEGVFPTYIAFGSHACQVLEKRVSRRAHRCVPAVTLYAQTWTRCSPGHSVEEGWVANRYSYYGFSR